MPPSVSPLTVVATRLPSALRLSAGTMAESIQTAMCGFPSTGARDSFGRLVRREMLKEEGTRFLALDSVRLSGLVISSTRSSFSLLNEFFWFLPFSLL